MVANEPDDAQTDHGAIELDLLSLVLQVLDRAEVEQLFRVAHALVPPLGVEFGVVLKVNKLSIAVVYKLYQGVF